ncbi:MAG: polymer-forming cytoskeletal protein [Planctomycetes bacterium]|nr:polymer-forming cytoskeletal protein [Planctomycetota bacterium]
MGLFTKTAPLRRQIHCPLCAGPLEVGGRTQSIVCPHCNRSIDTSDHVIDYYCAKRLLETSGDVIVERGGTLRGEVKASRIIVRGKLYGVARARVVLEIEATGEVGGEVFAPQLRIAEGAVLQAAVRAGAGAPPQLAVPMQVLRS